MIPQNIIDQVLDAANIVDVISDYQSLTKAGANYKCVCPFHDDKDASLIVSPAKRIFKCFGCGTGGNAVKFVQEHQNISFPEALRIVGDKYNVNIPDRELSDDERRIMQEKESLLISLQAAQELFAGNLKDKEATTFLRSRKFKDETIKAYGLGFAPFVFQNLTNSLTQRGYKTDTLIRAGLVTQKDTRTFDRFINRITFPFHDLSGRIVGFTGRAIKHDDKTPKFLNSPDTELFNKSNILFGLHSARQAIQASERVYFVEGQFDVMRMHENGYSNTVCGSGTALTIEQAKLLKRFARTVVMIYDGDPAGVKASVKNVNILLAAGLTVRAAILPTGEDPDSFVLKMGEHKFRTWLKNNETNFIRFFYQLNQDALDDPGLHTQLLETIAASISAVPNPITRANFITDLSAHANLDDTLIRNMVADTTAPIIISHENKVTQEPGVYGLDEAKHLLGTGAHRQELTVTSQPDIFSEDWGTSPTVFIVGKLSVNDLQDLRAVSSSIACRDNIILNNTMEEPALLKNLKKMHLSGFSVMFKTLVNPGADDDEPQYNYYSFTEHYITLYSEYRDDTEHNYSIAVQRCAEIISHADETARTIRIREYASTLGLTKTNLEKIINPYLEKRKSDYKFKKEFNDDEDFVEFSSTELPAYVEENDDLKRQYDNHGFFPLINKKGKKTAYMFRHKNSFLRVGNFYIEPLLHIYDKNSEDNKRVVELTQRRKDFPVYMEWISKDMITTQSFRQRLWEEGDITFSNGSQEYLNSINESWEGRFQRCTELHMYGYYDEGFFAFSNAIYHQVDGKYQIQNVTDLGLVTHNNLNYYIPVFSKIYRDERRDNDRYFLDRFVRFREPEVKISFDTWAELFVEVYKENNNGMWGIIYAFMCAFRSEIFSVDRIFTALFFIGPTGSGKSEIAYSIRSLFIPPTAPIFNLNQGTDAAMFTLLEKYRDIPVILDEYNDIQISDVKFQGLKAAVYDGEGKQKRKDASSKELDTSEVNSPLLICGQEAPQRDDNSLANRSIIRNVPKKDDRTEREDMVFRQLKEWEKNGLQNILLDILQLRSTFRADYMRVQREVYKELKTMVREKVVNSDGLSRIQNTYSMFLAVCQIIENKTTFKLPFTYEEFRNIVLTELLKQVESISSSNRLYNFFSIIDTLIDNNHIIEGRDYKIETPVSLKLRKQGRDTYDHVLAHPDTQVLHLRIDNIYPHYARYAGHKEALSRASLMSYLQSHESWIGASRSTRWTWSETIEIASGNIMRENEESGTVEAVTDPTVKRIRQQQSKTTSSIVLNYDILQELLDVDYTRKTDDEAPTDLPF